MSRTTRTPQSLSPAAQLVQHIESILKRRGAVCDNLTPEGAAAIVAQLRTGLSHAAAIAHGGDRFNVGDNAVAAAVVAMERAALKASGLPPTQYDDEESPNTEPYYLLGLLVGVEVASGLTGGMR